MALVDLLSSLVGTQAGNLGFGQTSGAIDPGQSTAPGAQSSTPLSELMVQGKKQQLPPPTPMAAPANGPGPLAAPMSANPTPDTTSDQGPQTSSINYNNSQQAHDVNAALQAEGPAPGGMANPGLYGLLPQNLQHGTLRNALGALGDALLVSGGRQPQYEQRMQQQQIGQAMAGMDINDPQSVAAAVQRVAATGAPGAAEMADKLQQQAEQAALRKQTMEYNNNFRTGMLHDRDQAVAAQQAAVADRYRPQIGGMLSGVKDAATYNTKYQSLSALAKQLGGPDATPASVWSIPEPGSWTPALTAAYGQTAGQQLVSGDKAAGRAVTMRGQDMNQQNSQGRDAAIRARPGPQENQVGYIQSLIARKNGGGPPLNADESAYLTRNTTPPRGAGRSLPPGLTPGGGSQQFVNGRVYTDAHGNHATYQNGKWIPHN